MNKNYFDESIVTIAEYLLEKKSTIRATAQHFEIPKSTVHYYLSSKLKYINYALYLKVKKLLNENFSVKHIHGGQSTKLKYFALKNSQIETNKTASL